jgi:hypothetical protein
MLRNAASHLGCELKEGDSGAVDRDLGEQLVRMGIAVEVESKAKAIKPKESTLKGVSAKPSIAESKPAEVAGDSTVKPPQEPEASS